MKKILVFMTGLLLGLLSAAALVLLAFFRLLT